MANHSRDDLEKQGNASFHVLLLLALGAGKLLFSGINQVGKIGKENKDIKKQSNKNKKDLLNIQSELSNYRGSFISSIRYRKQINELEKEQSEIINNMNEFEEV